MASLYKLETGEIFDFIRILNHAGVDADLARYIIRNPEAADRMVYSEMSPHVQHMPVVQRHFVSYDQQVANLRNWNRMRGWDFTEDEITAASDELTRQLGERHLINHERIAVLVPYPSADMHECMEELWEVIGDTQEQVNQKVGYRHMSTCLSTTFTLAKCDNKRHIRYLPEVKGPCLMWEYLSFAVTMKGDKAFHAGCKMRELITEPLRAGPHVGVLAAAAHFPMWLRKMDGKRVPLMSVPGCKVWCEDADYPQGIYHLLQFRWEVANLQLHLELNNGGADDAICIPRFV
jgi:hypothetical protein